MLCSLMCAFALELGPKTHIRPLLLEAVVSPPEENRSPDAMYVQEVYRSGETQISRSIFEVFNVLTTKNSVAVGLKMFGNCVLPDHYLIRYEIIGIEYGGHIGPRNIGFSAYMCYYCGCFPVVFYIENNVYSGMAWKTEYFFNKSEFRITFFYYNIQIGLGDSLGKFGRFTGFGQRRVVGKSTSSRRIGGAFCVERGSSGGNKRQEGSDGLDGACPSLPKHEFEVPSGYFVRTNRLIELLLLCTMFFGGLAAAVGLVLASYARKACDLAWIALGAAGLVLGIWSIAGLISGYFWMPW